MDNAVFLILLVLIAGFFIWVKAVHHLMARGDADFPAQYDKLAWAIFLTFTGPIGALVYFFFPLVIQQLNSAISQESRGQPFDSKESECLKCGAIIPDGQEKCPACGWSYTEG